MKKIMTRLLSLVLLGTFIPSFVLAETWDLGKGDITVTATETSQTVSQAGGSPTVDHNPVITSSSGKTNNTVTITAEKNATANVTLENVNIDTGTTDEAAITTSGEGNVNIELNGTNRVQSGNTHAGVEKKDNGTLTITDENKDGSLTATGGNYGAGIGGGYEGSGKGITIEGGEVTARGDLGGAGIGGGIGGTGSDVTISGDAQVKVQGGTTGRDWHKGAAIGNGGTPTTDGNEVSPNTSDLKVGGFIQIYEPGRNINTDTPDKTIEGQKGDHSWNAGEVTAETVPESKAAAYWVSDSQGQSIPYQAQQKDGVLTVTVQADTASLRGTTGSLGQLEAQGIAEIRFVTKRAQSDFTLSDLLTSGTGSFTLTHDGDKITFTLENTDISGILK